MQCCYIDIRMSTRYWILIYPDVVLLLTSIIRKHVSCHEYWNPCLLIIFMYVCFLWRYLRVILCYSSRTLSKYLFCCEYVLSVFLESLYVNKTTLSDVVYYLNICVLLRYYFVAEIVICYCDRCVTVRNLWISFNNHYLLISSQTIINISFIRCSCHIKTHMLLRPSCVIKNLMCY